MVAFAEKVELSPEISLRVRAQNHRCRSGVSVCSKSSKQANLRGVTYDEYNRLESCSKDPIGYWDANNLYQLTLSNPFRYVDPSGMAKMCVLQIPGSSGFKGRRHNFSFGKTQYFLMVVRRITLAPESASLNVWAVGNYNGPGKLYGKVNGTASSDDTGYVSCEGDCEGNCFISGDGGMGVRSHVGSSGVWFGGYAIDTYAHVAKQSESRTSITFSVTGLAGALGKYSAGGSGSVGVLSLPFEADYDESASLEETDPVTFTCAAIDESAYPIHVAQVDRYNNDAELLDDYFFGPSQPRQVPGPR